MCLSINSAVFEKKLKTADFLVCELSGCRAYDDLKKVVTLWAEKRKL